MTLLSGDRVQCITPLADHQALTGQKLDRSPFEIDDEFAAQDEKEFVLVVVFVPVIFALHDAEAHDGIVHPAEGLIEPLVADFLGEPVDVDQSERIELDVPAGSRMDRTSVPPLFKVFAVGGRSYALLDYPMCRSSPCNT